MGTGGGRTARVAVRRDQLGAVAAEQVAIVAIVAAVIAALWAIDVPRVVAEQGRAAVCALFGGDCDLDVGTAAPGDDTDGPASPEDRLATLAAAGTAPDGEVIDLAGPGGVDGDADLRAAADAARLDPDADADVRAGATRLHLADEAARLQELADRDGADLAAWEELRDLEYTLGMPTAMDGEEHARATERVEELRRQVEAAPDGSLLAELRDTEDLRGRTARSSEDNDRLLAIVERAERSDHAADLAAQLDEWARSGRTFLHAEVDLEDGTVRLAELVHGDLHDASDVAIVVPGTGSNADNFDRRVRGDARALAQTLDELELGDDVAVVACLCYAPPPGLGNATSGSYADDGGPDLARIIGSLPVDHDANVRTFGHSYGATALGRAVERAGLEVTELVSLGGPGYGSGVQRVEDLPDSIDRVWGVRHPRDPINEAFMHGRNPDRPGFGAHGFDIGDGDLPDTWWPYQMASHSVYYQDRESLTNLALIAAGRGDEVSGHREGRR